MECFIDAWFPLQGQFRVSGAKNQVGDNSPNNVEMKGLVSMPALSRPKVAGWGGDSHSVTYLQDSFKMGLAME